VINFARGSAGAKSRPDLLRIFKGASAEKKLPGSLVFS